MKVYFDLEFTGLHQTTTPISIGLVSDSGATFYAEFTDYNRTQVTDWLRENVLDHLTGASTKADVFACGDRPHVARALTSWLAQFDAVEVWGDCLAWDWVLFCELFGGAFCLPQHISYIPRDLSTALLMLGHDPDVNREQFAGIEGAKHNALHDALTIRACVQRLVDKCGIMLNEAIASQQQV